MINMLAIGAAIVRAPTLTAAWIELLEMSAIVQPTIIVTLLVLVAFSRFLRRLPYYLGAAAVSGIAVCVTALMVKFVQSAYGSEVFGSFEHYGVLVLLAAVMLLVYFDLRERALSPALA